MIPGCTDYDYLRLLIGKNFKPGMSKQEMVRILAGNPPVPADSNNINSLLKIWAAPPGTRGIPTDGFSSWDWLRVLLGPLFEPGQTVNDMLRHLTIATLYGDTEVTTSNGLLAFTVGLLEIPPASGVIIGTDDIPGAHSKNFTFYYSTTEYGAYVPATSAQGIQNPNNVWTNGSTVGLWYKATEIIGDVTSGFSNPIQSTRPPIAPTISVGFNSLIATNNDPGTPQEYVFYAGNITEPYNFSLLMESPSSTYNRPPQWPVQRYTAAVIVNGILSPQGNSVVC